MDKMNWQETVKLNQQETSKSIRFILRGINKRSELENYIIYRLEAQAKATWEARQSEVDEAYNRGYEAHKAEMCDHCDTPLLREGELYQKLDEAEQRGIRKVTEWIKDHRFYCADVPPKEGVAYGYLGNYILRFGKEKLPSVGFYELSDDPEWQAFLKGVEK
jgi:hypothetical protein